MPESMELNKVNVRKSYNVLHVTSPHLLGGMGLHQLFWAHRARFITMVQNTLRSRPGSIGCDLSKELPSRAVAIRNYLAILTQLGARTALHIALSPRPAGGSNLIDSESSDDCILLSPCKELNGWGCPPNVPLHCPTPVPRRPLGGHGARGIPPCHHRGHAVLFKPATANQNVPIL